MPDNWILCRLSAIADIFTGNSINEAEKQKKYMGLDSGYNYIGTKDVGFDHSINYTNGVKIPYNQGNFRIAHINTPLLCIEGGSAGRKIGVLTEDVCFGNKLCAFEPIGINPKYLYYYLQNPIFTQIFKEKTTGIIGGVSVNSLKNLLFAMPPLAEQERIVAEIEKFEPLIAEYDKLEQQATKLDGEIYDKLKKSILQYAIQGNLVPQNSNDEPASVLLERIRAEKKAQLGKKYVDSYIYKGDDNCYYENNNGKVLLVNDFLPFDLPEGWAYVRLENVFNYEQPTEYIVESTDYRNEYKTPVLTAGKSFIIGYTNETTGIKNDLPVIIFDDFTTDSKYVDFPFKVKSSAMKILTADKSLIDTKYAYYIMQTVECDHETHKRYWISEYGRIIIGLPPLNEQLKITSQIEYLFSLLDNGKEP